MKRKSRRKKTDARPRFRIRMVEVHNHQAEFNLPEMSSFGTQWKISSRDEVYTQMMESLSLPSFLEQ